MIPDSAYYSGNTPKCLHSLIKLNKTARSGRGRDDVLFEQVKDTQTHPASTGFSRKISAVKLCPGTGFVSLIG